ncbi:hypothetical protein [Terriglobus albidus]|uniref:hypothetical protein n=1 Tax=Terriglobus albidus TaxID=1592106 RepID=UPI0021E05E95|nr:hypothetical protein [Terriglobus albidus]
MEEQIKEYRVLSRIDGDRRYEAGDTIKLSDKDAAPLLATQGPCIEPLDGAVAGDTTGGTDQGAPVDLQSLKMPELKAMATGYGLTFAGNISKVDLIALIEAYEEKQAANEEAGDTTGGTDQGAPVDLQSLKMPELKAMATGYGLTFAGNISKVDLIALIEAYEEKQAANEEAGDATGGNDQGAQQ